MCVRATSGWLAGRVVNQDEPAGEQEAMLAKCVGSDSSRPKPGVVLGSGQLPAGLVGKQRRYTCPCLSLKRQDRTALLQCRVQPKSSPEPACANISHQHRAVCQAGDALDAAAKARLSSSAILEPRALPTGPCQGGHCPSAGVDGSNAGVAGVCHCQPAVRHLADPCGRAEQGLAPGAALIALLALAAGQHGPAVCGVE